MCQNVYCVLNITNLTTLFDSFSLSDCQMIWSEEEKRTVQQHTHKHTKALKVVRQKNEKQSVLEQNLKYSLFHYSLLLHTFAHIHTHTRAHISYKHNSCVQWKQTQRAAQSKRAEASLLNRRIKRRRTYSVHTYIRTNITLILYSARTATSNELHKIKEEEDFRLSTQ